MRGSKIVVWSAFLLCAGQSILFNVLHAGMVNDSRISAGSAIIWPLAAVLGVEILARVPFSKGRVWTLAKYGGVGLATVGAMVISYGHTFEVLTAWGEPFLMAAVGPLVVDGLMTLSGAALLAMSAPKPTARRRRRTTTKPTTARRTRGPAQVQLASVGATG